MEKIKLENVKKSQTLKFICQILGVIAAGVLGGYTYKTFFESVGIIPTGFSGLASIISGLFARIDLVIPASIIYLVINVILFLFAYKYFGWKFMLLSGIGMGAYTLTMQFGRIDAIINSVPASQAPIVFSIVGALLSGLAVGIALQLGGSTGGSDIAGALINKKFPKIKTGYSILIINIIVLILSIITNGVQTGLYAVIVSIISSLVTNFVLERSKSVVAYYIITDKEEEVSKVLLDKLHRGVTKLDAQGIFSKKDKKLLLSLVPASESTFVHNLVLEVDKNAFMFSNTVNETIGEGNFMLEKSIFKSKVRKSKPLLKTENRFNRIENIKKLKLKRRQKKFRKTKALSL